MRFLVDEPLQRRIVDLLSEAGHNPLHVPDLDLLGAPDEHILGAAADDDRILVTAEYGLWESARPIRRPAPQCHPVASPRTQGGATSSSDPSDHRERSRSPRGRGHGGRRAPPDPDQGSSDQLRLGMESCVPVKHTPRCRPALLGGVIVAARDQGVTLAEASVDFARERAAGALDGYPMVLEPGREVAWGDPRRSVDRSSAEA